MVKAAGTRLWGDLGTRLWADLRKVDGEMVRQAWAGGSPLPSYTLSSTLVGAALSHPIPYPRPSYRISIGEKALDRAAPILHHPLEGSNDVRLATRLWHTRIRRSAGQSCACPPQGNCFSRENSAHSEGHTAGPRWLGNARTTVEWGGSCGSINQSIMCA